jgi:hypothetical protein
MFNYVEHRTIEKKSCIRKGFVSCLLCIIAVLNPIETCSTDLAIVPEVNRTTTSIIYQNFEFYNWYKNLLKIRTVFIVKVLRKLSFDTEHNFSLVNHWPIEKSRFADLF